eukprot:1469630-Prymnesium_polylepis.1
MKRHPYELVHKNRPTDSLIKAAVARWRDLGEAERSRTKQRRDTHDLAIRAQGSRDTICRSAIMEDALDADTIVRIEGLVSRADLNGCRALVLAHIVTERVAVRVLSTNESVKVKPSNLVRDAVAKPEIGTEAQLAGVQAALNISDNVVDVATDDTAAVAPDSMPRCAECAAFGATKIC